ncbi:TRAP transporter small permease subunit [Aquamicrobium sp. LC103]|uniref:TRAP transporter small permease subunit n=1 Tax=Aquamicrobium sp. LC103 TaxID=1120658 RepID=UPI00063E766A|nr:TRAP transporter small permease subunit [Aquamicrobium sp. LC103]TKT78125.1 TRAP transporter small permease subunit [Aquamicrobium sp. LC103]
MKRILDLVVLPGKWVGWLVLPLILSVCLTVLAARMGWNAFVRWDQALPVLGRGITVNTLADLQWYIFAIVAIFGGVYAFRDGQHVSVDVFSAGLPRRVQLGMRLFGDLVFLLPFCAIIFWYGWSFALTSFNSGEGSTYGGLMNRWLIKSIIPIGFALLGIAAITRAITTIGEILHPAATDETTSQ